MPRGTQLVRERPEMWALVVWFQIHWKGRKMTQGGSCQDKLCMEEEPSLPQVPAKDLGRAAVPPPRLSLLLPGPSPF